MDRSEKRRVGEIAHEFAHVVLAYMEVEDHKYGGPKAEVLADRLACRWGFQAEIDELNSDGNGPSGEMGITVWYDREFGNLLYMNVAGSSNSLHSNLRVVQGGCSHDNYVLGRSPYS